MVVDVETTGLNPASHTLREVACVLLDASGRTVGEASWRVGDGEAQLDLFSATLSRWLVAGVLVAHNLRFDLSFLEADPRTSSALPSDLRWLCTLNAGSRVALGRLAEGEGVSVEAPHTALGDARTLAGVPHAWIERADSLGHRGVAGLVLARRGGPARPASLLLRDSEVGWHAVRAALPRVAPTPPLTLEMRRAFSLVARDLGEAGPLTPTALDETVHGLLVAGITAILLTRLLDEAGIVDHDAIRDGVPI